MNPINRIYRLLKKTEWGKISEKNKDSKHTEMTKGSKIVLSELQKEGKAKGVLTEWRDLSSGKIRKPKTNVHQR